MNIIPVHTGLQGFYKLEKHKADAEGNPIPGTCEVVADWFPNLITDNGKNIIGNTSNLLGSVQVGTGNTAPSFGDVALANRIGSTSTVVTPNGTDGAQGSPPYFGWTRKHWRFAMGAATGNLAEVGVGPSAVGNLFSRALIVDGGGAPTVITVLSDEILDVYYELRFYPVLTDLSSDVVIEGVTRATVLRAARVTVASTEDDGAWAPSYFSSIAGYPGGGTPMNMISVYGGNATLGAITTIPTPQSGGGTQNFGYRYSNRMTVAPYVTNTFYRDLTFSLGLGDANIALGVGAVYFFVNPGGGYQISFNPPLNKTLTKILTFVFRISWDRHTPP